MAMAFSGCGGYSIEIRKASAKNDFAEGENSEPDYGISEEDIPQEEEPEEQKPAEILPLSSEKALPEEEIRNKVIEYIEAKEIHHINAGLPAEKGISVHIMNAKLRDGRYFEAEIILEKAGSKAVIPIEGLYHYKNENSIICCLGDFMTYGGEEIVFLGHRKSVLINPETLETAEFSKEFPDYGTKELWVNMFCRDIENNLFYAVLSPIEEKIYENGEDPRAFFLTFDGNGNFVSEKEMEKTSATKNGEISIPVFFNAVTLNKILDKNVILRDSEYIDTATGERNYYFCHLEYSEDERTFRKYPLGEDGTKDVFTLYEDGMLREAFSFDMGSLEYPFRSSGEHRKMYSAEFSEDGTEFTYKDKFYGSVLKVDFRNKNVSVNYEIEEKMLTAKLCENAEGTRALYKIGFEDTMEILLYEVILCDEESGKLTYLGDTDYYQGTEYGFLGNGDCFLMTGNSLRIFDRDGNRIFDLSDNFETGSIGGKTERELITFRREPDLSGYTVIYAEGEPGDSTEVSDEYGSRLELTKTYHIAFLDGDGKLKESYDTGCAVWKDFYVPATHTAYYTEEAIYLTVEAGGKFSGGFLGVFNKKTHEFTMYELEE